MTKTYYVSQTEDKYIIYKDLADLNIYIDTEGLTRGEIENIGDVFVSNNEILQIDLDCVPYSEIIGLICAIKTTHLNSLKIKIVERQRAGDEYIFKLAQQLSNLGSANRRKKKALRQADKDLKFLRNALEETQKHNEYLKKEIKLLSERSTTRL